MDFKKKDILKIISYDVFVLALVVTSKSASAMMYKGSENILKKVDINLSVEHSPLIAALLTSVAIAFQIDINTNFSVLGFRFLLMLLKTTGVLNAVGILRSKFFINCSEYVKELPNFKPLPELDLTSSALKPYTRELPTRYDGFVSTSPNLELHYQEDLEIATLDGKFKEIQKLNGDKNLEWLKNRQDRIVKPKYIPLKRRTKTLADVKNLDTTFDKSSALQIINSIQKDQITARLIRESLDDM